MRATRRNVLVILGVLTIAGGALFGTGAFTQVSADRTVSVSTADNDASAQLGLAINDSSLAEEDGSNGVIEFSESDLNQEAVTEYHDAFQVNNRGEESVSISITDGDGNNLIDNTSAPMYFTTEANGDLETGDNNWRSYDVVFNTSASGDIPDQITVTAES